MSGSAQKSSDWPTFVPGEKYTWAEISDYTWSPGGGRDEIAPETLFECRADGGQLIFDEVVPENPFGLIPASEAQAAVEHLRRNGMSTLDIARLAGISQEAARRAEAGHGQLRRSTRDALIAAAASVNGKAKRAI
jgi:hypothetical protein